MSLHAITLEKIELIGYKFLSSVEFSELEEYIPGITYFIYNPSRDFTDTEDNRPELMKYFMRADRCVKVDMSGNLNEVYEITDALDNVVATYGTSVKFIYGSGQSDFFTITLPVGDTYEGKLPIRPNTTHLLFSGWTRNGEAVGGDTIINYGDELRANFKVAGDITHPFGALFAETGRWVVNNNDFTASYAAEIRYPEYKIKINASATYTFSTDTINRDVIAVTHTLDETFLVGTGDGYNEIPLCPWGNRYKWFSPYGVAVVQDIATSEVYLEHEYIGSTIFQFAPNIEEHNEEDPETGETYTVAEVDYTGKMNIIYLSNLATNVNAVSCKIESVQMDGTLRIVGNYSFTTSKTALVTWDVNDIGVIVITGGCDQISVGNDEPTAETNYDIRPVINVINYAGSSLIANGFYEHSIAHFNVSSDVKLRPNCLNGAKINSIIFAKQLSGLSQGCLTGLSCDNIFIDGFTSISTNWANGYSGITTVSGYANLIIQTIPAGVDTTCLATGTTNGASKFNDIAIIDCHAISGTSTTSKTFDNNNIYGGIFIKYADDVSIGAYGFYSLQTVPIRLYNDNVAGIAGVRATFPPDMYGASVSTTFYGNDFLGIELDTVLSFTGSPITKLDTIQLAKFADTTDTTQEEDDL